MVTNECLDIVAYRIERDRTDYRGRWCRISDAVRGKGAMTNDLTDRTLAFLGARLVIVMPRTGHVGRRHHGNSSKPDDYGYPSNGVLTKVTRWNFHNSVPIQVNNPQEDLFRLSIHGSGGFEGRLFRPVGRVRHSHGRGCLFW